MYRGRLDSCNYRCEYCPFVKSKMNQAEREADQRDLARFVDFLCGGEFSQTTVAFIPKGEILVQDYYRSAVAELTRLNSVESILVQTNLSLEPSQYDRWLDSCETKKLVLWSSFHPSQTTVVEFAARTEVLRRRGVRFSVGAVGCIDHLDILEQLRQNLPPSVTFWINPKDDDFVQYSNEQLSRLERLDSLFVRTAKNRSVFGTPCRCGKTVFTVVEYGFIRRCPFIPEPIGTLGDLSLPVVDSPCPLQDCRCFIGYVHWETDEFRANYVDPPLARIGRLLTALETIVCSADFAHYEDSVPPVPLENHRKEE